MKKFQAEVDVFNAVVNQGKALKPIHVDRRHQRQKTVTLPADTDTLIKDTRDVRLLRNEHIRELFNDKKHKIHNHLKDNSPPKSKLSRKLSEVSNLDEEPTLRTGFTLHHQTKEIVDAKLDGDIFQFTNKDRYKSK